MTIAEVEPNIALQRPLNVGFSRDLAQWTERQLARVANRILPVDAATAHRWGIQIS